MKVRRKYKPQFGPHEEYEVVKQIDGYYLAIQLGVVNLVALDIDSYEPLPTDQWQDVTEALHYEGETEEARGAWCDQSHAAVIDAGIGYRLVKEQFLLVPCPEKQPVTANVTAGVPRVWAFRVERKR